MQGSARRPPAGILTRILALDAVHGAAEQKHFPVMTELFRAEFHNSHGVTGMTNDVCVRDTRPRQPGFCWVSFSRSAELKSETLGLEQRQTRRSGDLGENEFPSRV